MISLYSYFGIHFSSSKKKKQNNVRPTLKIFLFPGPYPTITKKRRVGRAVIFFPFFFLKEGK